jgi:transcriptional regulator with PAS, ATPase and Fis domain
MLEYPGNVRTLRNLIYELTSYVQEHEPISIQLVQFALAKLNHRIGGPIPVGADNRPEEDHIDGGSAIPSSKARNTRSAALHAFLRDIAREGEHYFANRLVRITTR